MAEFMNNIPDDWEPARGSDASSPVGRFQHKFLDVEISVSRLDADEFGDVDAEYIFSYFIEWCDQFGAGIEAPFDPPGDVTTESEATNWMIALMNQISQQFEPGDTDYVSRAMRATRGESVSSGSHGTGNKYQDAPTCLVCDAPLFQFRGFDTYEQAQNHLDYMQDDDHEGFELSLTDE